MFPNSDRKWCPTYGTWFVFVKFKTWTVFPYIEDKHIAQMIALGTNCFVIKNMPMTILRHSSTVINLSRIYHMINLLQFMMKSFWFIRFKNVKSILKQFEFKLLQHHGDRNLTFLFGILKLLYYILLFISITSKL